MPERTLSVATPVQIQPYAIDVDTCDFNEYLRVLNAERDTWEVEDMFHSSSRDNAPDRYERNTLLYPATDGDGPDDPRLSEASRIFGAYVPSTDAHKGNTSPVCNVLHRQRG